MANNLTFSSSPHIKNYRTTKDIMMHVSIALLPACVMGVVYFGLYALLILALSVISAITAEIVFNLAGGKTFKECLHNFDFSSCVTGLLIGMTIGTNYPWYAPILGSVFAIIVVKMLFGGTGKNLVNPAIVGRIFIFMSFQSVVTAWILPTTAELVSGATPLESTLKGLETSLSNWDLFFGLGVAGCIGETCKIAILVGAIYLALIGIINIIYPIIYVLVTGLFTVALFGFDFSVFLPAILTGGLMLAAFFMATDYTTTPNTTLGNVIYFVLLGLLTAGLRLATKMEVVSFVILLANLIVPLIDKFVINRPFGFIKNKKAKGN